MYDIPPSAYIHYVQKPLSHDILGTFMASIIKFPPSGDKGGDKLYSELTCSPVDAAIIQDIITTVAKTDKWALLLTDEGSRVKRLGAQIHLVHPLKFLSTIFKDPVLRSHMVTIADDYFKWQGFMEGVHSGLTKEADKGKLDQYLLDFCSDIEVPSDRIKTYFQNRDWDALAHYLINYFYP